MGVDEDTPSLFDGKRTPVRLTSLPTHRPAFTSLLFSLQPSDEGLTTAI